MVVAVAVLLGISNINLFSFVLTHKIFQDVLVATSTKVIALILFHIEEYPPLKFIAIFHDVVRDVVTKGHVN